MSVEILLSGASQCPFLRSNMPQPLGRFATAIRQISLFSPTINAMR